MNIKTERQIITINMPIHLIFKDNPELLMRLAKEYDLDITVMDTPVIKHGDDVIEAETRKINFTINSTLGNSQTLFPDATFYEDAVVPFIEEVMKTIDGNKIFLLAIAFNGPYIDQDTWLPMGSAYFRGYWKRKTPEQ